MLTIPTQVFNDIEDDQYDFHGYSIRKFMLNAYLECVFRRAIPSVWSSQVPTAC